jgi:hypothetical protein
MRSIVALDAGQARGPRSFVPYAGRHQPCSGGSHPVCALPLTSLSRTRPPSPLRVTIPPRSDGALHRRRNGIVVRSGSTDVLPGARRGCAPDRCPSLASIRAGRRLRRARGRGAGRPGPPNGGPQEPRRADGRFTFPENRSATSGYRGRTGILLVSGPEHSPCVSPHDVASCYLCRLGRRPLLPMRLRGRRRP